MSVAKQITLSIRQFEKIVMRDYTVNIIRVVYSMVLNSNFLPYIVVYATFYRRKNYAYKW